MGDLPTQITQTWRWNGVDALNSDLHSREVSMRDADIISGFFTLGGLLSSGAAIGTSRGAGSVAFSRAGSGYVGIALGVGALAVQAEGNRATRQFIALQSRIDYLNGGCRVG